MVSLLSRAVASLLARQPKPAQRSTPRRAFASAPPTSRAGFLLPSRAYASDRVRHAAPRGQRMSATPVGWRPVAPASKRASPFSSHRSSASPCASHFSLPRCLSASPRTELRSRRHRHRSPAGKIGTGGPPLPAIEHTSLRLAPRHPVLAAGTPFEQGTATLRIFATVSHGAAALGLAVEGLPPSLLHPLE